MFIVAAIAGFAGFAVLGLFTAVSPAFVAQIIGIGNHAVAGAIVCSIFAASAVAQLSSDRFPPRKAVAVGCAVLVVGALIIGVSLHFSSLVLLITGAVIAGVGQGISFSRGIASVVELVPPERKAEVSSTYFVVAYIAISLPVIGAGLAAQVWGLRTAGIAFALVVSALAAVCLAAIVAQESRSSRR